MGAVERGVDLGAGEDLTVAFEVGADVREFFDVLLRDAPASGADAGEGHASVRCSQGREEGRNGLPVFDWAEDVVGFEEAGENEESQHDAGSPGEYPERERRGEGRVRTGVGLAKDDCAEKGDGGGEGDEEEHLKKPVGKDLGWLEDGLGVFDGEEESAEKREAMSTTRNAKNKYNR